MSRDHLAHGLGSAWEVGLFLNRQWRDAVHPACVKSSDNVVLYVLYVLYVRVRRLVYVNREASLHSTHFTLAGRPQPPEEFTTEEFTNTYLHIGKNAVSGKHLLHFYPSNIALDWSVLMFPTRFHHHPSFLTEHTTVYTAHTCGCGSRRASALISAQLQSTKPNTFSTPLSPYHFKYLGRTSRDTPVALALN